MPVFFNPIAFESSMSFDGHFELAGLVIGRTLQEAVHCPYCGATYHLIVPAAASLSEVEAYRIDLREALSESCGMHPPFVQKQ